MSWPWKIGLWTFISTLYIFSRGAPNAPPQAIHRFRPPSLFRVKSCILYPVSCILYPVCCILYSVSCSMLYSVGKAYILSACTLSLHSVTCYFLYLWSCILYPVSCMLFPVSYILIPLYFKWCPVECKWQIFIAQRLPSSFWKSGKSF